MMQECFHVRSHPFRDGRSRVVPPDGRRPSKPLQGYACRGPSPVAPVRTAAEAPAVT